jgi:hypothetical protein
MRRRSIEASSLCPSLRGRVFFPALLHPVNPHKALVSREDNHCHHSYEKNDEAITVLLDMRRCSPVTITNVSERPAASIFMVHFYTLPCSEKLKLNSVALIHKRTIPTERPPIVGEVSTNVCGERLSRGQRNRSPRQLISIF